MFWVAFLATVALAGCNGGTVDKHALEKDAESIASLATEGSLLAHDASKGATTTTFARVQSQTLAQQASNLSDALGERPTEPGLGTRTRAASRLAAAVAADLERLGNDPNNRGTAQKVEEELQTYADKADSLAKAP